MTGNPTTPHTQHPTAITRTRFRLIHFRSPLLTEYLFLLVLRCFTSQRTHPRTMNSHAGDQTQLWPGFPIRTSSDQHSLANSPRHIAGCNVLLRPFMPRHPPNALKHLQKQTKNTTNHSSLPHTQPTTKQSATHAFKMLASTIQFPNTTPTHQTPDMTEAVRA